VATTRRCDWSGLGHARLLSTRRTRLMVPDGMALGALGDTGNGGQLGMKRHNLRLALAESA